MINHFVHALAFSAAKHRDQRRKDVEASPYINHPISLVDVLVNELDLPVNKALNGVLEKEKRQDKGENNHHSRHPDRVCFMEYKFHQPNENTYAGREPQCEE